MAEYPFEGDGLVEPKPSIERSIPLEQAWNELRSTFPTVVPVDEAELATICGRGDRGLLGGA